MIAMVEGSNGMRETRQWANLFDIGNLGELEMRYRLLEVRGLPDGEHFDKSVTRLSRSLSYQLRQPVALVRRSSGCAVALPAAALLPELEQRLMPYVATLVPDDREYSARLDRLDENTTPVALAFLRFALNAPLWRHPSLWQSGHACYRKRSLNASDAGASVDVYPGFVWSVVAREGGQLALAVDTRARYVERIWLSERVSGGNLSTYYRRSCLYHFGHQWYLVQLWGKTGLSIAEQRFQVAATGEVADVYTYTRQRWAGNPPPWITALDPQGQAILYRQAGSEQERHGALALCKLTLTTAESDARGLHRQSIMEPVLRFQRVTAIVQEFFQDVRLGDQRVRIATAPLEVPRRVFALPAQRFGADRVVAVGPQTHATVTDAVTLEELGRRRLELVLDPSIGPLDDMPFDAQHIFLPESAPRAINEDFARWLELTMRRVSGRNEYTLQRILYDDRAATSLPRQVAAVEDALRRNGITRGYGVLVLPAAARRDLHNFIKRKLWPHVQLQCATAAGIARHYVSTPPNAPARVAPGQEGKLRSYVLNCALGLMAVNRKWLWSLAAPLHYDVYIGIDVLNQMAGFTFLYGRGEHLMFHNYPCTQKERLTTAQIRQIIGRHLRDDLANLGLQPRSIVVHRDGRSFRSELNGLEAAVRDLKRDGVLPPDVVVGVVDVRKSTADNVRLAVGPRLNTLQNPTVGGYYVLTPQQGVVCTTGRPFAMPGTAKPLTAQIASGPLDIAWVLEDLFALSQLVFTAPDKCARLPVTLKLADDFLEPIAGATNDDEALYGDDDATDLDGDEPMDDSGAVVLDSMAATGARGGAV